MRTVSLSVVVVLLIAGLDIGMGHSMGVVASAMIGLAVGIIFSEVPRK